jgi:hypothetical protein
MAPAPIVLFVYNRPAHTAATLAALRANHGAPDAELVVFCDGPRRDSDGPAVRTVRDLVRATDGFRSVEVIEHDDNRGLAPSIIAGVSQVIAARGSAIVLEDDLVTSPHFLRYMNAALERYAEVRRVFSVSGYNPPPQVMQLPRGFDGDVYFNPRPCSWGWATWRDRWQTADWEVRGYDSFMQDAGARRAFAAGGADLVDLLVAEREGRVQSWAIRWTLTHFLRGALALYPVRSYVDNAGNDGSGVNSRPTTALLNDLTRALPAVRFPAEVAVDPAVMRAFRRYFLVRAAAAKARRLLRRLAR